MRKSNLVRSDVVISDPNSADSLRLRGCYVRGGLVVTALHNFLLWSLPPDQILSCRVNVEFVSDHTAFSGITTNYSGQVLWVNEPADICGIKLHGCYRAHPELKSESQVNAKLRVVQTKIGEEGSASVDLQDQGDAGPFQRAYKDLHAETDADGTWMSRVRPGFSGLGIYDLQPDGHIGRLSGVMLGMPTSHDSNGNYFDLSQFGEARQDAVRIMRMQYPMLYGVPGEPASDSFPVGPLVIHGQKIGVKEYKQLRRNGLTARIDDEDEVRQICLKLDKASELTLHVAQTGDPVRIDLFNDIETKRGRPVSMSVVYQDEPYVSPACSDYFFRLRRESTYSAP